MWVFLMNNYKKIEYNIIVNDILKKNKKKDLKNN